MQRSPSRRRGASNSPGTIGVDLLVEGPAIGMDGASVLQLETPEGSNPPPQIKRISNSGGGTLNWTAETDRAWLDVTPSSGSLDIDQGQDLTVAVSSASLAPGSYRGTVTLLSTEASNSPRTIEVSLSVHERPAIGVDGSASLLFETEEGTDPHDQTKRISNVGEAL